MKTCSIFFFFLCRRIRLKLVIFLFYNLLKCNKKAEILRLATVLIAHLRSKFSQGFEPIIFMPRFKTTNFSYNWPKILLFLQKNCKTPEHWGYRLQTPNGPQRLGTRPRPQR